MATKSLLDSPVWKLFEEEARKRSRDPEDMVATWIRECLEAWEDEALDDAIEEVARRSGYREDDAADLVRRFRREQGTFKQA
ncbi:MAG: hypothetical protein IPM66_05580 [Acidobacteriota bacterium]|nr:MAG: hypothetical protein IPM66_05580 [Acidobacteriota bacterium]